MHFILPPKESTMVWTPSALETLRLCRNRAYHKVNTKRRQHLPASLSAFTLREWNSVRPGDKFSAKYILETYNKVTHILIILL